MSAFSHEVNTRDGCYRPDEHAPRHFNRFGDDVKAVVLAGPKHIGVSGRTEQHFGALRSTAVGMGGGITLGEIGFGLDDATGNGAVDQPSLQADRERLCGAPDKKMPGPPEGVRAPVRASRLALDSIRL